MTDRELLDLIDRTPWIADSLILFDFEVGRAADGPIQLATLAGGEQLEPIAGDAAGGCFLLVGTGTDRPVLYVGSEGEGGLVANSLREALALVVGVASLHDATAFPIEEDDGRALRDYLARADDEIREDWPELDADRERLRKALGLVSIDDALLRSLQTAAADIKFRPLNEWGDRFRPMLAWLEDAEQAEHPEAEPPPEPQPVWHKPEILESQAVRESPFGVRLSRLLSQRRLTFNTSVEQLRAVLVREAGLSGGDLAAVIEDGAAPDPDFVRKLAPALGIHGADLFVIAGLPVPDDLASAWPTSPWDVGSIVGYLVRMDADQRRQMEQLIRSLPVQPRHGSAPSDDYPDIPGALLLRLLRNRNIRPCNARILKEVGDGPYVSDSTVIGLGRGTVVITPQYVTAFAHLLGYPPSEMVALTGVGPVVADARVHPASAEIAAMAWQARLLDSEQLSAVVAAAHSMRLA